jgi:hypothetical protein
MMGDTVCLVLKLIKDQRQSSRFIQKIQQDATVYQNFILYLYKAQHVSGNIPTIIRSLKLH